MAHIQPQILRRTARPMDPSDSCTNVTSSLSGKCPALCRHFLALLLTAAPSLLAFLLDGGLSFFPVPCDDFPREPLSTVCASVSGVDVKVEPRVKLGIVLCFLEITECKMSFVSGALFFFLFFFFSFYFSLSVYSGMQSIKLLIQLTADRCDAV